MKKIKVYALVTQFIFQVALLTGLGYFIGYSIDNDGLQKGILAIVGAIIGIFAFIIQMIKVAGDVDGKQ